MPELQKNYSLDELLHLADANRRSSGDSQWQFLNEDLLKGMAWVKAKAQERISQKNVSKIIDHLYHLPIWKTTPSYSGDKKFAQVIDLYYLTEHEIEGFAYSFQIPCGPKTLQRINNILTAHQLPPLHEVTR